MTNSHENLHRSEHAPEGSERSFGLVFAAVFAIVGLWKVWAGQPLRLWALGVAVGLVLVALAVPVVLRPFNWLWLRFGLLVSKVMNPVVMAIIFFVVFTPIAVIMRVIKRDALHRSFDRGLDSYWIQREPRGPGRESMINQF